MTTMEDRWTITGDDYGRCVVPIIVAIIVEAEGMPVPCGVLRGSFVPPVPL